MSDLIKQVRPILKNFSKAKAAKLVRGLVDMFLDIDRAEGSKGEAEVQLCQVQSILTMSQFSHLCTYACKCILHIISGMYRVGKGREEDLPEAVA